MTKTRFCANIPTVYLLWHNRLFTIAEYHRRYKKKFPRKMYSLVSASKDGAWLAEFFQLMGIEPVRGSSSNRGTQAIREIINLISQNHDVGITPDGPRGPCYHFQPGAILAMKKANAAIMILGFQYSSAWRLKSWDGFYIPKPFSKVTIKTTVYESFAELEAKIPEGQKVIDFLREKLIEYNPD